MLRDLVFIPRMAGSLLGVSRQGRKWPDLEFRQFTPSRVDNWSEGAGLETVSTGSQGKS